MRFSDLEPSTLISLASRMERWPEARFNKTFVIAYIRKAAQIHATARKNGCCEIRYDGCMAICLETLENRNRNKCEWTTWKEAQP